MGNARWTGARLRELLDMAGVKSGSLYAQFQGVESGQGPEGFGSQVFLKSLELTNPVLDECVVAYLMSAGHSRLQTAAAVAGALVYGGNGNRFELLDEIGKAEGERFVNIPLDAQPPIFQINCIRDSIEMPPNVESFVKRECRAEIMARGFELNWRSVGRIKGTFCGSVT
jgi:Oxidoreductase molybdopterin binding domain